MPIYAYADETIFTIDNSTNQQALGYGIFISSKEITQVAIDNALNELRQDSDFETKRDQRTIDRKHFHASEDTKNAHSHLCSSINKNIKGVFDFTFFDNVTRKELVNTKVREFKFARCLSASTLEFFNSPNEVLLIIEKREGLNESVSSEWLKNLYRLYEGSTYELPSFKTYFPKINIEFRSKSEPGLQVVDFLIWSMSRSKRKPADVKWLERIKFKAWHHYREENGNNRCKYYLNYFPTFDAKSENYPHPFQEPANWDDILDAYVIMEKIFVALNKSDFTPESIHLFDDFNHIASLLKKKGYHLSGKDLDLLGRSFLHLFDTVPLYKHVAHENKEAWDLLFYAKHLASMLVRNEQIHFGRTKDAIQRWRYIMKTERESEFNKLLND